MKKCIFLAAVMFLSFVVALPTYCQNPEEAVEYFRVVIHPWPGGTGVDVDITRTQPYANDEDASVEETIAWMDRLSMAHKKIGEYEASNPVYNGPDLSQKAVSHNKDAYTHKAFFYITESALILLRTTCSDAKVVARQLAEVKKVGLNCRNVVSAWEKIREAVSKTDRILEVVPVVDEEDWITFLRSYDKPW